MYRILKKEKKLSKNRRKVGEIKIKKKKKTTYPEKNKKFTKKHKSCNNWIGISTPKS